MGLERTHRSVLLGHAGGASLWPMVRAAWQTFGCSSWFLWQLKRASWGLPSGGRPAGPHLGVHAVPSHTPRPAAQLPFPRSLRTQTFPLKGGLRGTIHKGPPEVTRHSLGPPFGQIVLRSMCWLATSEGNRVYLTLRSGWSPGFLTAPLSLSPWRLPSETLDGMGPLGTAVSWVLNCASVSPWRRGWVLWGQLCPVSARSEGKLDRRLTLTWWSNCRWSEWHMQPWGVARASSWLT